MRKKTRMGPHKLLKVCNGSFFGGLGLTAVIYLIGESYLWRGDDVPVFLWIAAGIGILSMLGSVLAAFLTVRCPYCDASLMSGGRMPTSLPHFCPDCGKDLDDCG